MSLLTAAHFTQACVALASFTAFYVVVEHDVSQEDISGSKLPFEASVALEDSIGEFKFEWECKGDAVPSGRLVLQNGSRLIGECDVAPMKKGNHVTFVVRVSLDLLEKSEFILTAHARTYIVDDPTGRSIPGAGGSVYRVNLRNVVRSQNMDGESQ